MNLLTSTLVVLLTTCYAAMAQPSAPDNNSIKDSTAIKAKEKQDSLEKAYFAKAVYPLIKSSKFSGVIPVTHPTEVPDPNQQYKLLMEVVADVKDSADAKQVNSGFAEVGRLINLHIASGIPLKNLHVVMVVHGGALQALLNNDKYRDKYKIDNPNLPLFKELQDAGVTFIACGQAMYFFNINKEDMIPGIKVSLTAQTVLSNYQLKGYVLYHE